jgi:hypothetical protein
MRLTNLKLSNTPLDNIILLLLVVCLIWFTVVKRFFTASTSFGGLLIIFWLRFWLLTRHNILEINYKFIYNNSLIESRN